MTRRLWVLGVAIAALFTLGGGVVVLRAPKHVEVDVKVDYYVHGYATLHHEITGLEKLKLLNRETVLRVLTDALRVEVPTAYRGTVGGEVTVREEDR
jgi:hypothetical protein